MAWNNKPNPQGYAKNWPQIRAAVLSAARYVCALNLRGCQVKANEVDHIDGDVENNNANNLRALCNGCHQKVTIQNQQDARNLMDPRGAEEHPGRIKEIVKPEDELVDDLPTEDESQWIETHGPVFQTDDKGRYKLPKHSLAPFIIEWALKNLQIKGEPFRLTTEQIRILYWMYALDDEGRWLFNRTLHIGPKGWGKDPFGAFLCAVELCGPSRFSKWDKNGNPVPRREYAAWIQIAAVSHTQNENTLLYLRDIFTPKALQRYKIEIQSNTIYAFNRKCKIESVSSSSNSKEGNFPTFVMESEGQHYFQSNGMHALHRVLSRNLAKVGNSHSFMTTNAYNPNEASTAQNIFEKWEEAEQGTVKKFKTMVVMKGATHKAPTDTIEQRMKVLRKVYGASTAYTDVRPFAESFDDTTEDITESKRFYYNLIGIESMSWIDPRQWEKCKNDKFDLEAGLPKGTKIVLAGDMSKNDDSSALVAMVTTGPLAGTLHLFGLWEKPKDLPKEEADVWQVPRAEVDAKVKEIFTYYRVQGFWCDPSHKMDDDGGSYWMPLINEWAKRYSNKIPPTMWAKPNQHAINWDMASHANQRVFVESLLAFEQEVTDKQIKHDGNPDLKRHVSNARRFKSKRFGSTISKESPRSAKKIDAAVTAVIAFSLYTKISTNRKTTNTQMTGRYNVPESS